ncbi:c-type cytochrome [Burkholderia pyrrocinia]|uniref:C-type cytochrome n=1 Tax=Burkholderia pyrrocinia TaxID=60550 RepID=A0ABZ3BWD5_BURPY
MKEIRVERSRAARALVRAVVAGSFGALCVVAHAADPAARVHELTTTRCAACHGVDGNSNVDIYPRLAGQYPQYLYKQLTQFKGGPGIAPLRHSAVMQAMVEDLSDEDMRALGDYYSAQKPAQGESQHQDLVEAGKAIYTHGGAGGAPACISCHREAGGGIPPDFPRITGQHESYVNQQLHAWKSGARGGKGKLMSLIVPLLSNDEIAQVSAYVASLKQ